MGEAELGEAEVQSAVANAQLSGLDSWVLVAVCSYARDMSEYEAVFVPRCLTHNWPPAGCERARLASGGEANAVVALALSKPIRPAMGAATLGS